MLFQVRRKGAGVPKTLMRNFRVVRPHKTMKKAWYQSKSKRQNKSESSECLSDCKSMPAISLLTGPCESWNQAQGIQLELARWIVGQSTWGILVLILGFARLGFPMLLQVRRKDEGVTETLMRNFQVVRPHKTMKKAWYQNVSHLLIWARAKDRTSQTRERRRSCLLRYWLACHDRNNQNTRKNRRIKRIAIFKPYPKPVPRAEEAERECFVRTWTSACDSRETLACHDSNLPEH